MKKRNYLKIVSSLTVVTLVLLSGCQTYSDKSAGMASAWTQGDYEMAAIEAAEQSDKADKRDKLIWLFEEGAILQMTGDYEYSNEKLDAAETIVDDFEAQAKVKVAGEAVALISNQATLPYRGKEYEKILMNTYKAINFMAIGEYDNARVEFNRMYQRQENAVIENSKRIEEARIAAEKASKGELADEEGKSASYDVDRAREDPGVSGATGEMLSEVDERILPYADYVNPFSVFLEGIYFAHRGESNSDIERALKSFERVRSMSPGEYIDADYMMTEGMANGQPADKVTYIVLATGSAPSLKEFRLDIPVFLVSSEVSYVGAAFPRLDYHDDFHSSMMVSGDSGASFKSQLLSDMDAIVSREFKNDWPAVMTKTILSAGIKATAGYLAEQAVKDQDWRVRLAAKIANIGTQALTSRADLRTWTTLPKQFSYVRIPTPESGLVSVQVGGWSEAVEVVPGMANLVIVRSVNYQSPPAISKVIIDQ